MDVNMHIVKLCNMNRFPKKGVKILLSLKMGD